MVKPAAIYHFTDKSERRPIYCRKQIEEIKKFAVANGYKIQDDDIYLDKTLKYMEHTEFDRFLSISDKYEALFAKDFYHISKNTGRCLHLMQELQNKGIKIYTIENGSFTMEDAPIEKPLQIATYTSRFGEVKEMKEFIPVKNDIFRLFANKKTMWKVIRQYYDESKTQNNGDQIQLNEIIKDRNKYDLLLVDSINDVHWRTSNFCKLRNALGMDIYSLQDGFLPFKDN